MGSDVARHASVQTLFKKSSTGRARSQKVNVMHLACGPGTCLAGEGAWGPLCRQGQRRGLEGSSVQGPPV